MQGRLEIFLYSRLVLARLELTTTSIVVIVVCFVWFEACRNWGAVTISGLFAVEKSFRVKGFLLLAVVAASFVR